MTQAVPLTFWFDQVGLQRSCIYFCHKLNQLDGWLQTLCNWGTWWPPVPLPLRRGIGRLALIHLLELLGHREVMTLRILGEV